MSTTQRITAWSYSRYNEYRKCPARAYYKFILKKTEPGSPAMDRGAAIHTQAEQYLKAGGRLPPTLKLMEKEFKDARKLKASAEGELAFTKDWKACDWFDMKNCWVRIKIDAMIIPPEKKLATDPVRIIDHKTGKIHPGEYDEQLELYGLAGLLSVPMAQWSTGELWFLDHGQTVPLAEPFKRADEPKLKKQWEIKVKKMLTDEKFKPTPGDACRFCFFQKAKGGPCVY